MVRLGTPPVLVVDVQSALWRAMLSEASRSLVTAAVLDRLGYRWGSMSILCVVEAQIEIRTSC